MVAKTPVPAGLGKSGRALWRSLTAQIAEDGAVFDARELRLLRDACRSADDLARVEAALADADLIVKGSQGQPVPNGLLAEARSCRQQIAQLLGKLDLDMPADELPITPALPRSVQARKAANARWQNRGA